MAVRDLIGKLPDYLKNDPSVELSARGRQGKHRHGGAPDLPQQELRVLVQGLRLLPRRHGRALGGRRARRAARCATRTGSSGRNPASHVTYDLTRDAKTSPRQKGVNEMGTLTGKTAVVTGSTSGIGLAYARAFAGDGANVVINGFGAPADIETRARRDRDRLRGQGAAFAGRHDQAGRDRRHGRARREDLRRGRYPGQQCRHPVRRADRGIPDREMGPDHRDQPVRRPSTPSAPRCPA